MSVRFVGHGHPAIRATHDKTLELTLDADIGERATCVVAVGTTVASPTRLAGPIRIEIVAGAHTATVHAHANSSWRPGEAMIVRRSAVRGPGTFATHADTTAADLPRGLVEGLRDPAQSVEVTITPQRSTVATVVLYAHDGTHAADGRLRAELEAADRVVAEDADARRRLGPLPPQRDGLRVLAVATEHLPGGGVLDELRAAERIETVGLSPAAAAAAACPARGTLTIGAPGADARALLQRTPAAHRLVLVEAAARVPELVELATTLRGESAVTLVQAGAPPVRTADELAHQGPTYCCFAPAPGADALDPQVRAAIDGLLADGVATKTAAAALATLTGWERRRAYDAVLALRH